MDSGSGVIVTKEREKMKRIENPFTLKVGQVFTGFGIGCGIGIGVGRPLNLGAIPMLNQVMVATRGATDAFSGVGRQVNNSLRSLGAKNIEAGIGCGIGFGHGFGIGLAVKPGVIHQIQSCFAQLVEKAVMKIGMSPNMFAHGINPKSIQSGSGMVNEPSTRSPLGNAMPSVPKNVVATDENSTSFFSNETSDLENNTLNRSHTSRTEKVICDFLQNPLLRGRENEGIEPAERLRSENNLLHLVLKHQQVIEELMQENEKLRQILVEDLKVPPTKLQASSYWSRSNSPCSECFECRRKQRRR